MSKSLHMDDAKEKSARKNAENTRGRPFEQGNPGRPKGSRNRATRAIEQLLEGEAEVLTRKAIELAMAGDVTALRLCLERISPPRRGRLVHIDLPVINAPTDALAAIGSIVAAVGKGEIDVHEATALAGIVDLQRRAIETVDLDVRLKALEGLLEGR